MSAASVDVIASQMMAIFGRGKNAGMRKWLMMNELLKAVVASKLTENQALDLLQEAGAISDLCLKLSDIADADCLKAVLALSIYVNRPNKRSHR